MKWIVFLCLLAVYSVQAMPSKDEEEQAPVEEVAVESNNEEEEEVDGVKSRNKRSYPGDDPYPEPSGLDVDVNVNVNVPQGDIKADIDVNVNVNAGCNNWENGLSDDEDNDWEAFGEDKNQNCVWNFPENSPLLLDGDFNMVLPVMEEEKRIIRVTHGTELTIACPGGIIKNLGKEVAEGMCDDGKIINVKDKPINSKDMSELSCSKKIESSLKDLRKKCGAKYQNKKVGDLYGIGFNIKIEPKKQLLYEMIGVCFDREKKTTIYSKNTIHGKNIAAKYKNNRNSYFRISKPPVNFGVGDISEVYKICSQKERMLELLENVESAYNMFCPFYFEKGHMAPKADFVTKAEQDATYYYINAVPQWNTFNNGNWKQLEESTRKLAENRKTDLTVYTGTLNVLKLEIPNKVFVDIYLGYDKEKEKEVVPAPELIWKVIHDESINEAVAVVGINNPHIIEGDIEPHCTDICDELEWLKIKKLKDLESGYIYCCDFKERKDIIENILNILNIPNLADAELLKNSTKELSPEMESK